MKNNQVIYELKNVLNNFRWRDFDVEERCEKFTELLKFVRFHVMSQEDFAKFVVLSGVLNKDEMLEIFMFFSGQER